MANRAVSIRRIFVELRSAVGKALAAADILRLANIILGKSKRELAKEESSAAVRGFKLNWPK